MEKSTAAMMIRDVPIDLRMQLRVIAATQRRRLRDVAIEALQEKAEKHSRECTNELGLLGRVESYR
jgi:plasmid stability protein